MQDQDLRTKDSFLLPCWTLHLPVLHLAALYNFKLKTSHMISGHILSWSKSALLKQQICVDVHQLKFWTIFQNNSTLKWPKLQPPNNPVQQMNVNLTSHCKMLISHFSWKYSHHRSDVLCLTFILWEEGAGEGKQGQQRVWVYSLFLKLPGWRGCMCQLTSGSCCLTQSARPSWRSCLCHLPLWSHLHLCVIFFRVCMCSEELDGLGIGNRISEPVTKRPLVQNQSSCSTKRR